MTVNHKTILVTGGGNGVGRALVLQLLEKGASVIALDINEEALQETAHMTNHTSKLFTYKCDIANKEAVFEMATSLINQHGAIDGIINNAGIIQSFIHLNDLEMESIDRVMQINFWGTLYIVKAFLPHLLQRPHAHIVNVSSMGGFLPVPGQTIYGASKAAVKLLTEGLASELKDTSVGVSLIIPGGIATEIKKNSHIEHTVTSQSESSIKILTPQEAAALIIQAMERDKPTTYLGKDCKTMKVLHKWWPSFARNMINKVMKSRQH